LTKTNHMAWTILCVLLLCFLTTSCSKKIIPVPSPVPSQAPPVPEKKSGITTPEITEIAPEPADALPQKPEKEKPVEAEETITPRALASLQLTRQGVYFLENGDPDKAISVFEKAVSLHPGNGKNYYYLAEAWLAEGNVRQATEFNRLAGMYLDADTDWMKKVLRQKKQINKRR